MSEHGLAAERCPCCDHRTLPERGGYDICHVCFWEDDDCSQPNAEYARCGPNHGLILNEGRANYLDYGACSRGMVPHVRRPTDAEARERAAYLAAKAEGLIR